MNNRYTQARNCEKPDRVPFLPAIYEHKAWFVGETPSKVARDPHLLTAALIAEYERVRPDALTIGVDIYNVEAEAIGCQVTFYEEGNTSVPSIGPEGAVFQGSEDVTSLKLPDPRNDGRMPLFLDVAIGDVRAGIGRADPLLAGRPWEQHAPCRTCAYLPVCGGGCLGGRYLQAGHTGEVLCRLESFEKSFREEVVSRYLAEFLADETKSREAA